MFNPLDTFIARQAVKRIAEEQFSQAELSQQPKPRRFHSVLAALWRRRPQPTLEAPAETASVRQTSERFA